MIALLLVAEKFLLSFLVDSPGAQAAGGFGAAVRIGQHWGLRFAVTFALALALIAYLRPDARWADLDTTAHRTPLRPAWLAMHAALALALAPITYSLYGHRGIALPFWELVAAGLLLGAGAIAALFAAMAPWSLWRRAGRTFGVLWLYAALAAAAATAAMRLSESFWAPTAKVTFVLVDHLLAPIIPSLRADASDLTLYSDRFSIRIADACSGLEGMGLMLAFSCIWLLCFRREYRFPRALVLIPVGLLLIFLFNALRIAALMLIGYTGFPDVAMYGFHSQAGWIAFNCAAGAVAYASLRSRWLAVAPVTGSIRQPIAAHEDPPRAASGDNPTAAYLMPFLAILAMGMLARAVSSGFETLYVLQLIAAAAALLVYRRTLASLDWRFSWRGPLLGVAAFALWSLAARFMTIPSTMPPALAAMPASLRALWIVGRVTAAVITVPIAEELAYRGYLMRRLISANFESMPFAAVRPWALALSAAVFGASHGALWLPGIAVGLIYGMILIRTGRIGEAVTAHATTNGLLAIYVLVGQQWQLW
jgi:exosortase E/protease (VPEID-CTERM system)